jgi:hypothetical protein
VKHRRWTGRRAALIGAVASLVVGSVALRPRTAAAEAGNRNACGCYKDGDSCYCDKKARCGCPGECEPKGCEEKRARELEKEVQAETKRAQESERKHGGGDQDEAEAPARPPAAKPVLKKVAARKLSAQQRRELSRLLDLYVGEHPDDAGRSLRDVQRDLAGDAP